MPRWKLRIEGRAESEARSAFLWYMARNPRAAERFQAAFEECIDAIAEAPERFAEVEPGIRRRLLFRRFPYAVLYRVIRNEVLVVAVMHLPDAPDTGDDEGAAPERELPPIPGKPPRRNSSSRSRYARVPRIS